MNDLDKAQKIFQSFAILRNEMTAAGRPVTADKCQTFLTTFHGGNIKELARLFDLITEKVL